MVINKNNFVCKRCGFCCGLDIKLEKKDIENIKKLNYKEEYFNNNGFLKKINHFCIFLKNKTCTIHGNHPIVCKTFPFYRDSDKINFRCKALPKEDISFIESALRKVIEFEEND